MNVREYRLGNIVEDEISRKLLAVNSITHQNVSFVVWKSEADPLPDGWTPRPIQLSPLWMDKLEFKEKRKYWKKSGITIILRPSFSELSVNGNYIGVIKYVHHLQNLYFVLTGNELI